MLVLPNRNKRSDIVEVDETYVEGEKAGIRGRGADGKVLVANGVEIRDLASGRIRMKIIEDASSESLKGFIKENVY